MTKIEEAVKATKITMLHEAVERLSKTNEWQTHGKLHRLYMLCIDLELTHISLHPLLKEANIEL